MLAMLRTLVEVRRIRQGLQTCVKNQSDGKLTNLFNVRLQRWGLTQRSPLRHPARSPSVRLICSITRHHREVNLFFKKTKHHFRLTFLPLYFKFQFLFLHSLFYTKLLKSPTALQSKIFQKEVMPNLDWLKWNQTEGKIFWTFPWLVHCLRIWQQVIKIDCLDFPHVTNTQLSVWSY